MNLRSFLQNKSLQKKFTHFYRNNSFNGSESISGKGSDLVQTAIIRDEIPLILEKLNARVFIDAPCGDFFWMKYVDLKAVNYIGLDIVEGLIKKNSKLFSNVKRRFICCNIVSDELPSGDVILIRDCWVHLADEHIFDSIMNLKRSGITYLLTTSFPQLTSNSELSSIWRPINLELPPFNFPEPIKIINEGCTEDGGKYSDKSLVLWEISKLPEFTIK